MQEAKIILPGGAGLVGQNLVARLKDRGCRRLVVLDKHRANLAVLARMHPDIHCECVDLAEPGSWQAHFRDADAVVMLQAQIGGKDWRDFERNNIEATRHILDAMRQANSAGPAASAADGKAGTPSSPYLIHISSSVVNSRADDFYTRSKKAQEAMVLESGFAGPVLRPTLMFGWFDRKHLGWLARFMRRVPVFPIPGDGRFRRQPLYAGDFCEIIISCLERRPAAGIHNISGLEKVDYIDIIREIRRATGARSWIRPIPYRFFHALLWLWSRFDPEPPFTTQQLRALVINEEFEVIDWPAIFGVKPTPFRQAVAETFQDPRYGQVALEF